jgi:hypothetical protein
MKSFRPKGEPDAPPTGGRNGERDFHGEQRRNDSHASSTDPDARCSARAAARRPGSASWAIY